MVIWHHKLNGHEFEQAPGDGEGQGGLDMLQSMGSQRAEHDWVTEHHTQCLNNSTKPLYFQSIFPPGDHLYGFFFSAVSYRKIDTK